MAVCSFASQSYRYDRNYAGSYTGGPFKGLLHTTEGGTLPSYGGGASAPHFTVLPALRTKTVRVYQHYDTNRPARALLNKAGGVQTNNDSVVQIELVGTCDPRTAAKNPALIYWPNAPQWALDGLKKLMRWVEDTHDVPRRSTHRPWLPYPDSYGNSPARMGQAEFDNFAGWLGHQHAAENDHGDPGDLDMGYLLALSTRTTVVKVTSTIAALAASLGLSLAALLGVNPALPATPDATVTPGTEVTLPAEPAPVAPPAPAPSRTDTRPPATSSYRVVTAPASARPVLRRGDAGPAVKAVQAAVGQRADGLFGPGTDAAVRAFQRAHGLTADGIVGPRTWAALIPAPAAAAPKPAPAPTPAPAKAPAVSAHPVLRYGAHGPAVTRAQTSLGVRADGAFGPLTLRAVQRAQAAHRLTVDGVIGPRTWAVLEQAPTAPAPAATAPRPVLREGDVSRHVRTVQAAVGATVDGIFGPRTRQLVIVFQSRHGLTRDGIVGPATWAAIR